MVDYKLPKLEDLSIEDIKYVGTVLKTFSADDLNHLVMHGCPEECRRCEVSAKQMPRFEGFMMDMTNPIWTEVLQLAYELETESAYRTVEDRKGQWEKLTRNIKFETAEIKEFDWFLHGGKGYEHLESITKQGIPDKTAKRLLDDRFDYEVKLRYNSNGKLVGAEGYYLSDKSYQPN
ncbi:hypothetical protein LCGC14_0195870 [marine sediment metagenome]|uniref:Uncharacterized protein n=1 Tax=marine sediment metagenome TaxID=412755 RepID=A0A0F9UQ31_9ZZZZ